MAASLHFRASPMFRFLLLASLTSLSAAGLAAPRIDPVPGGIAEIILAPASAPRPQAFFAQRPTLVLPGPKGWRALVGVPLDLAPGIHDLAVRLADRSEQLLHFTVESKEYPLQRLRFKDSSQVEPDPATLARIQAEQQTQDEVKTLWRDVPAVDLAFILPATGRRSSPFGLRRLINDLPRAPHRGVDLAVPTGTPVLSPAQGVVTHVGDFFFNGRTIFVDHGQGLISMLCHLDQIEVDPGQAVGRGERLGRSGASGRATGPHLHWTVFLNGKAVDPELFVPAEARIKPPGR